MLVGGADKAWPRMPLAIFSAERASRTHYNRRGDPSCDLEPISWEYAPMKHHDTGVLLAWLVTRAIVALRDRPLSSSKPFGQTCWPLWSSKRVCDAETALAAIGRPAIIVAIDRPIADKSVDLDQIRITFDGAI
jgi:hypothetical protein